VHAETRRGFLLVWSGRRLILCGMFRFLLILGLALVSGCTAAQAEALIVADEFPAMEFLAGRMKAKEGVAARVVAQRDLPEKLAGFECVIVYIHGALEEKAENAFIDYAESGGKLLLLHHSISSGKRKNARWFAFLGVKLPEGDVAQGGYKWIEDVSWTLVNLAPNHFIMTNGVTYPQQLPTSSGNPALPGFTLTQSEVYLNHVPTSPRTLLMGLKYRDAKTGAEYAQDTAGWIKRSGKGWTIYLMPGHSLRDLQEPAYLRIVLNAVVFRP